MPSDTVTFDDIQDMEATSYMVNGSDAHLFDERMVPAMNNMSAPYLFALAGMLVTWDRSQADEVAAYAKAVWWETRPDGPGRPEAAAFLKARRTAHLPL